MKKDKTKTQETKSPLSKSILSIVIVGLFIFCIIYIFRTLRANAQNKLNFTFGYTFSVVRTPSMEPVINVNDIVVIKNYKYEDIKEDDIIVYYSQKDNIFIVHRVIGTYNDGSLITKGDNNLVEDDDANTFDSYQGVTSEMYIGKVVKYGKFLGLGWLLNNGRTFIFVIVIGIFVYLLIMEFINIKKSLKEESNNKENEPKELNLEEERERLRLEVLKELEEEKKKLENKDQEDGLKKQII